MPRIVKPLTDTEIKLAKPKDKLYKLSDGQNLFFVVQPNGTKFFRYDYTFQNKRKSMSFGTYPDISLKDARAQREQVKQLLKQNIDPIQNKRNPNLTTFKEIATKWLIIMENEWKPITMSKARGVITNNTFPFFGDSDIADIKRTDILNALHEMEKRNVLDSANRLLNYLDRIYKYAVTYNYVEHNIIADIDRKNAVKKPTLQHFPAVLKEKDIKNLMKDIQTYGELFKADVSTIYALQLAPYVFLRPFNLRHLEWKEINFEKEYLEIDGSKMKTGKDFVLPLCKTALNILETMKPFSYNSSSFVFPSPTSNLKAISDGTLNQALMRLGYKDIMTSHGFRAMFSTTAHEHIKEHGFHTAIIESCLAHTDTNKVRSAYNRESKMKYFEEKRELLEWWEKWLIKYNVT